MVVRNKLVKLSKDMSGKTLFFLNSEKSLYWKQDLFKHGFEAHDVRFEDVAGKTQEAITNAVNHTDCNVILFSPDIHPPLKLERHRQKILLALVEEYSAKTIHSKFVPGINGIVDVKELKLALLIKDFLSSGKFITTPLLYLEKGTEIFFGQVDSLKSLGQEIDLLLGILADFFTTPRGFFCFRMSILNMFHHALLMTKSQKLKYFIGRNKQRVVFSAEFHQELFTKAWSEEYFSGDTSLENRALVGIPDMCDTFIMESIPLASKVRILLSFSQEPMIQVPVIIVRECDPQTIEPTIKPGYYKYLPAKKETILDPGFVFIEPIKKSSGSTEDTDLTADKKQSLKVMQEKLEDSKQQFLESQNLIKKVTLEKGQLQGEIFNLQKQNKALNLRIEKLTIQLKSVNGTTKDDL